ncbi:competence type IV pilus minor pilin ComGG [Salipaludibacillus daqingensis]|uniref:competence type IV pilus minor pilin ComGG n=1 Tax=Salipaludibacillus daqingensis TaxID=3041001 RepID=UPI002474166E|nr:competence type IV pilus minor pilin ComGG [Salipaludibacillus daqingensis]
MNDKGFALLLVLFMMMFLSLMTIHLVTTYSHEKLFLGLEKEQHKLEHIILNGKVEVINIIELNQGEPEGDIQYPEGKVSYHIQSEGMNFIVSLRGETDHQYTKRASFTYNRDTKIIDEWREVFVWD